MSEVEVSVQLLGKFLDKYEIVKKAFEVLERDPEYNALVEMSNVMAVKRLRYNDHGPVHARIVAGSSLEIFDRLVNSGVKPTTVADKTTSSVEEAALIIFLAAMLHDVGNSIHRENHEMTGALLAKDLIDRVLARIMPKTSRRKRVFMRQEIMHAIHSTSYDVQSLTIEAGCVKIGDGTDMSKGRARIPYKMGKSDIHAVSALSIERVTISSSPGKPVVINVYMSERAGVFQIERVLYPKINTSGLKEYVDVKAVCGGRELRLEF